MITFTSLYLFEELHYVRDIPRALYFKAVRNLKKEKKGITCPRRRAVVMSVWPQLSQQCLRAWPLVAHAITVPIAFYIHRCDIPILYSVGATESYRSRWNPRWTKLGDQSPWSLLFRLRWSHEVHLCCKLNTLKRFEIRRLRDIQSYYILDNDPMGCSNILLWYRFLNSDHELGDVAQDAPQTDDIVKKRFERTVIR